MSTTITMSSTSTTVSPAEDTIVPVAAREQQHIMEGLTFMLYSWVVHGHLDTDKMKDGWSTLAEHGQWRKLGARVQRNPKTKKYEWRIPHSFSTARPPVHFTTQRYNGAIASFPQFAFPRPTPFAASMQPEFDTPETLLVHPSTPRKLSQYLHPDHSKPFVNMHVSQFDDSAVVALAIPHFFTDALGVYELVRAWLAVLRGETESVPREVGGYEGDIMAAIAATAPPTDSPKIRLWDLGLWIALRFCLALLWEKISHWTCETRTLFIPEEDVARLRDDALEELRDKYGKDVWISEGDVVAAWWLKACFGLSKHDDTSPANAIYAYGLAQRHASFVSSPFLHNSSTAGALQGLTAGQIASLSLGDLALYNRTTIASQTHPLETAKMLRVVIAAEEASKPVAPVPLHKKFATMSSWTRFDFWSLDFGCVGAERTLFFGGRVVGPMLDILRRNTMIVMGRGGGGFWLWATLRRETWRANPLLKRFKTHVEVGEKTV